MMFFILSYSMLSLSPYQKILCNVSIIRLNLLFVSQTMLFIINVKINFFNQLAYNRFLKITKALLTTLTWLIFLFFLNAGVRLQKLGGNNHAAIGSFMYDLRTITTLYYLIFSFIVTIILYDF